MRREGTIGAATVLAIAAAVGFSVQRGPKLAESTGMVRSGQSKRSKPSQAKLETHKERPGCTSLKGALEEFLAIEDLKLPEQCYEPGAAPGNKAPQELSKKTSQLKFIIALLPDPVHTHLSALFDQFAVAIQEGAQDEKYEYDDSWLPWDDEESSYARLEDVKASNWEKELKENQPGIILFRKTLDCPKEALEQKSSCKEEFSKSYLEGLVVFVVGEEATHGIHKEQFYNAVEWITALQPKTDTKRKRLAILGPTFSGSFSSVAEILAEPKMTEQLGLRQARNDQQLAIYSGSVSSSSSAKVFQKTFESQVLFHSFVQNDDEILRRFCAYITKEQPGFAPSRVAIISEDETAYGGSGIESDGEHGGVGQFLYFRLP